MQHLNLKILRKIINVALAINWSKIDWNVKITKLKYKWKVNTNITKLIKMDKNTMNLKTEIKKYN